MPDAERSGRTEPTGPPRGAVDPAAARESSERESRAARASGADRSASQPADAGRETAASAGRDATYRVHPGLTLLSLGLCLAGLLELTYQVYVLNFVGAGPTLGGLPSRVVFVFALTLVVSPLILAIFRRVPILFVLPPIALVFLLYPLFSPYGLPYTQDPIFNYQYAYVILQSAHWAPDAGVTLQAGAYSFYPGNGVFNAEVSAFTGIPLIQTFNWGENIERLLILPPVLFALGKRFFSERVGIISVLFFLATPSIDLNAPIQMEFAVPFFALTLVLLAFLVVGPRVDRAPILAAAVLCAGFVVISHHVTSYALAAWLGLLVVLWAVLRPHPTARLSRVGVVAGAYLAFLLSYTLAVSWPNFVQNYGYLMVEVSSILHPSDLTASTATSIGSSFPEYQLVWSYLAYLALILVSFVALRHWLRIQRRWFTTANLIVALVAVLVCLPLLVTGFSFLPERVMEYGAIFMAPAIAWWMTQKLGPRSAPPVARGAGPRPLRPWTLAGSVRPTSTLRRAGIVVGLLLLTVLIFAGANLVPFAARDQFTATSELTTESTLHIRLNDYELGIWAHSHLTSSTYVWGDTLALAVFGGFGQFNEIFNQYMIFNGTTVSALAWEFVSVGNYVVVDKYMTTTIPQFPGDLQPTAPLTAAQLAKFSNPEYFDLVYQDSTFTIYEVIAIG